MRVQEGPLIVARHFSGGFLFQNAVGTPEIIIVAADPFQPSLTGRDHSVSRPPGVEAPGYLQVSLRDAILRRYVNPEFADRLPF